MKLLRFSLLFLLSSFLNETHALEIEARKLVANGKALLEIQISNNSSERVGLYWGNEPWRGGANMRIEARSKSSNELGPPKYGHVAVVTGDGSCRWIYPNETLIGRLPLNDRLPDVDFRTAISIRWTFNDVSCGKARVQASGEVQFP